jgi:hypothetical protein
MQALILKSILNPLLPFDRLTLDLKGILFCQPSLVGSGFDRELLS